MKGKATQSISCALFPEEGRQNFKRVVRAVRKACDAELAHKIIVFTTDGLAALEVAEGLQGVEGCEIVAVTFPFGRKFRQKDAEVPGGIVDPEVRERLKSLNVEVVQAFPPFWELGVPGVPDMRSALLRETLSLFGGGTSLCVQAILMATDQGRVTPGETVISVAADTALVATGCYTESLFNPVSGMQIRCFLAKPKTLTLTRKQPEKEDDE